MRLLAWATAYSAHFNPADPSPLSKGLGKILVPGGVSVLRHRPRTSAPLAHGSLGPVFFQRRRANPEFHH